MSFKVLGTGHCVPERVLTNDELVSNGGDVRRMDYAKRVGVRERHICTTETAVGPGIRRRAGCVGNERYKTGRSWI